MKVGFPPVSVDEFFEKNLVFNLANLLGITENRIRVMEVVSASSSRRRRRDADSVEIVIHISDPPLLSVDYESNNDSSPTEAPLPSLQNYTGTFYKSLGLLYCLAVP